MVGVEAAGEGIASGKHAATLCVGADLACCTATAPIYWKPRMARSSRPTLDLPPASIIPAAGPEHAWLKDSGRARRVHHRPRSAGVVSRTHAALLRWGTWAWRRIGVRIGVGGLCRAPELGRGKVRMVNLSGRGDGGGDPHVVGT